MLGLGLERRGKTTFNITNDLADMVMYHRRCSGQTGISYRWTQAQAHFAAMEEKGLSCYHCIIDMLGSY